MLAERRREVRKHRCLQQKVLDVGGLPVEDLGREVGGDLAALATDLRQPLLERAPSRGQAGQMDAGGPAFGDREKGVHDRFVGRAAVQAHELGGLRVVEGELPSAELHQLAGRPQAGQRERRVGARAEHKLGARRQVEQDEGHDVPALCPLQQVRVVEHQHERRRGGQYVGEHGQHPLAHRRHREAE